MNRHEYKTLGKYMGMDQEPPTDDPEQDDGPDEFQMVCDELRSAEARIKRLEAQIAKVDTGILLENSRLNGRIASLEADLLECLEFLKKNYDADLDNGEWSPNEEMRLGTMIQCTLYGPGNF